MSIKGAIMNKNLKKDFNKFYFQADLDVKQPETKTPAICGICKSNDTCSVCFGCFTENCHGRCNH